jgi:hypothetical protein
MDEMTGIKTKVLDGIQGEMAKRRLLKLTIDLDKGTVETEGGAIKHDPSDEMGEGAPMDGDLGEPKDVASRLKKVLG